MKNKIINIILLILEKLKLYNPYDVNRDGEVNAQDYVLIKNYIMNKERDK